MKRADTEKQSKAMEQTQGITVSDTAGCCFGIIVGSMRHKQFKEIMLIIQGGFEYTSDLNSGQMRSVSC